MKTKIYIGLYLAAIVAANLLTARYGPEISILNAFLFIGLDLTTRDYLHEIWQDKIKTNMVLLIFAGSALSYAFNVDAGPIAIASFVAFLSAGLVDTVAYQALSNKTYNVKVNVSNTLAAAVDSIIFPTLAFGGVLWNITAGQFAAKVIGGFIWAIVINAYIRSTKS